MEYYEKALEIAKERGEKENETRAYLGLGITYRLNNQIQTGMEYYEKALERERNETPAYLELGIAYILNQIQTGTMKKHWKLQKNEEIRKGKREHTLS